MKGEAQKAWSDKRRAFEIKVSTVTRVQYYMTARMPVGSSSVRIGIFAIIAYLLHLRRRGSATIYRIIILRNGIKRRAGHDDWRSGSIDRWILDGYCAYVIGLGYLA